MSVSQLNKEKTYCEAGFIEGDVALSCTPEEHVDLHWDRKKTQSYYRFDCIKIATFIQRGRTSPPGE